MESVVCVFMQPGDLVPDESVELHPGEEAFPPAELVESVESFFLVPCGYLFRAGQILAEPEIRMFIVVQEDASDHQ